MKRSLFLVGLIYLWALISMTVDAEGQTAERPLHQIVFAIDNSQSMAQTDPTGLRGVAAGLILDGAALDAELQAGLVLFNDRVETDGQLVSVQELRKRLVPGPGGIPEPSGSTNMADGLERALGHFQGSGSERRTIVLISDGQPATLTGPDPEQEKRILQQLVPHAQSLGVRIYALGALGQVDQQFLDALTRPTGGSTLLFRDSRQLLGRAKELVGRQDDVHLIASETLSGSIMDFEFELPPGTDRARLTVVLDDAMRNDLSGFLDGQISFDLQGPVQADQGSIYQVRKRDIAMVGAWTTFLSQPGRYRLGISVSKPGIIEHGGLRVYVEALSVLELEAELSPIGQTSFYFDEELQVETRLKGGDGNPLDPATYHLSGYIDLPTSAQEALLFSGNQATFRVPPVLGSHRIVIEAVTQSLGRRTVELRYQARQDPPCELLANPDTLRFGSALGPENLEIEAAFRIDPIVESGSRTTTLEMAVTGNVSPGTLSLEKGEGGVVALDGRPRTRVELSGLELIAKIRLDGNQPLAASKPGKHSGQLRFQVPKGACDLTIPFEYDLRIPRFGLEDATEEVTLWWDPNRQRRLSLGSVTSDIVEPSTFTVALAPSLQSSNKIGPIGQLRLAVGNDEVLEPEADATRGGVTTYGPIELPPRASVDLDLVLEPTQLDEQRFWTDLGKGEHPFMVELRSTLGMTAEHEVRFISLGGPWVEAPWLGPLSPHGYHILRWLVLGLGALLVALSIRRSLGRWWRFLRFRPNTVHRLPPGNIRIDRSVDPNERDLVLPASGRHLLGLTLAGVRKDPARAEGLMIDGSGSSGILSLNSRPIEGTETLNDGDSITIEDEEDVLWELEYLGFDGELEAGEVEVLERPRVPTLLRVLRKLAFSSAVLWVIGWALSLDWLSTLFYAIPGNETFWLQFFGA